MAERPAAAAGTEKPVLQKPPGYRNPPESAGNGTTRPVAPPQQRRPQLLPPPANRYNPRKPPLRRRRWGRRCCRRVCCWFTLLIVVVIFVLAVAGGIAYLWFQPRFPSFRIESIQVRSFNVSSGPGGSVLNAAAAVSIQAANPNAKIALSYSDLEARVSVADVDGDVDLGAATSPGFVQPRKNSTALKFAVGGKAAAAIAVDDAAASRLRSRFKSKQVQFGVEVRTKVGVMVGGKSTGRITIGVLCGDVSLKQVAGGAAAAATSPKCRINLLRWITLR